MPGYLSSNTGASTIYRYGSHLCHGWPRLATIQGLDVDAVATNVFKSQKRRNGASNIYRYRYTYIYVNKKNYFIKNNLVLLIFNYIELITLPVLCRYCTGTSTGIYKLFQFRYSKFKN